MAQTRVLQTVCNLGNLCVTLQQRGLMKMRDASCALPGKLPHASCLLPPAILWHTKSPEAIFVIREIHKN